MDYDESPAEHLLGLKLNDKWNVVEKIPPNPGATGGFFSVSYIVKDELGHTAFLKALDLTAFFKFRKPEDSIVDIITEGTLSYSFERDLLIKCGSMSINRIIELYDFGEAIIEVPGIIKNVPYLVFEIAKGDVV
jgi:eukaryotic-like serine/threonine-protein kinase